MGAWAERMELAAWSAGSRAVDAADAGLGAVDRATAAAGRATARGVSAGATAALVAYPVARVGFHAGRAVCRRVGSQALDSMAGAAAGAVGEVVSGPVEAVRGLQGAGARWGRLAKYRLPIEGGGS